MKNRIKKLLQEFRSISKTDHKPYFRIFFEMIYWRLILADGLAYYFDYQMYLKGKDLNKYVNGKDFDKINRNLNTPEYFPLLEDKYFFYQLLKGQGFRIPDTLYLIKYPYFFDMKSGKPVSETDFLSGNLDGFCKLINGWGGKNIFRLDIGEKHLIVNNKEMAPKEFFNILGNRKFLVQQRLQQHAALDVLNPSCINTMRILTLRRDQQADLFQLYLRVGINNSIVDNGISGNIMVGIEKESGKLMQYAYSSGIGEPMYTLERHPQTGVVFKDYQLPYYREAVEMATSLHMLFQQFFMIGWDIGITPEGPVVIEGNNITSLFPFQTIYGGLKPSFFDYARNFENDLK